MTESTYFTPSIEDIRVGYECERETKLFMGEKIGWTTKEWIKGTVTQLHPHFQWTDYRGIPHYFADTFSFDFRVPYLTKEQLKVEGWEETSENSFENLQHKEVKLNLLQGYVTSVDRHVFVSTITIEWGNSMCYTGKCNDINTFRYITKLLGI